MLKPKMLFKRHSAANSTESDQPALEGAARWGVYTIYNV